MSESVTNGQHVHPDAVERLTFGQRAAEKVVAAAGSWTFVIVQSCLLLVWVTVNTIALFHHFDPAPFIGMNLLLSLQAAYTAPMILIAAKRQDQKSRALAINTYNAEERAEKLLEYVASELPGLRKDVDELLARKADP